MVWQLVAGEIIRIPEHDFTAWVGWAFHNPLFDQISADPWADPQPRGAGPASPPKAGIAAGFPFRQLCPAPLQSLFRVFPAA